MEPVLPFVMQTRQSSRVRSANKYNAFGDDFFVDRLELKRIVEEPVGLEEITASWEVDIVDDRDNE